MTKWTKDNLEIVYGAESIEKTKLDKKSNEKWVGRHIPTLYSKIRRAFILCSIHKLEFNQMKSDETSSISSNSTILSNFLHTRGLTYIYIYLDNSNILFTDHRFVDILQGFGIFRIDCYLNLMLGCLWEVWSDLLFRIVFLGVSVSISTGSSKYIELYSSLVRKSVNSMQHFLDSIQIIFIFIFRSKFTIFRTVFDDQILSSNALYSQLDILSSDSEWRSLWKSRW